MCRRNQELIGTNSINYSESRKKSRTDKNEYNKLFRVTNTINYSESRMCRINKELIEMNTIKYLRAFFNTTNTVRD